MKPKRTRTNITEPLKEFIAKNKPEPPNRFTELWTEGSPVWQKSQESFRKTIPAITRLLSGLNN